MSVLGGRKSMGKTICRVERGYDGNVGFYLKLSLVSLPAPALWQTKALAMIKYLLARSSDRSKVKDDKVK